MVLLKFFGDPKLDMSEPALGLYRAAVAAARAPGFYARHGVPDTPDGRFDMIALHVFLALRRLKREPNPARGDAQALAQALTDLMFADMDRNLREMGVGDLGVGKQVKGLAAAFRGRVVAYDAALERTDGDAELAEALGRNLWRGAARAAGESPPPLNDRREDSLAAAAGKGGVTLAMYVRAADGLLAAQPWSALADGKAVFPPPPRAPIGAQHS